MKKFGLMIVLCGALGTTAFAQLEDRDWMLGANVGLIARDGGAFAAPSVFMGKILNERQVLGAGVAFQINGSSGETTFQNQVYTLEYQSYKKISDDFPLSFFYAPSLFLQNTTIEGASLGAGFRLGLSYRPLDSWLIQITPLQTSVQFGEQSIFQLGAGSSTVSVLWVFGK